MFSIAPQFGLSSVLGFVIAIAAIVALLVFVMICVAVGYAVFKRTSAGEAIASVTSINPLDGIDDDERKIIEDLFKQKRTEARKAEIKEQLRAVLEDGDRPLATSKK